MTGPIASIAAIMISVAAALGSADCSAIIEEAARIEQEAAEREAASKYLIAIDAGHQEKGNFGQEPIGPGASQTKTKVAGGTRGTYTGVPEYELTLDISLQLRDELEDRGYRVLMIRETNDVDITNSERAQMANEANADRSAATATKRCFIWTSPPYLILNQSKSACPPDFSVEYM